MPLIRRGDQATTPPQGADATRDALSSPDPDARWSAARRLGDSPEAAAALGEALEREPEPRVREAMLTALARIGTAAAAEQVAPLLRSEDAGLRTGALDALRAMPQGAVAHLPALLADPDSDVRLLACEVARNLPADVASRELCGLIEREPHPNVCAAAVEVLAEVGGPEALPALRRCAQRFPGEPFLVFSITVAAQRIGAQAGAPGG